MAVSGTEKRFAAMTVRASALDLGATQPVADLAGTLTGATDGTIADVPDIALSTANTYTDAAVNAAVNGAIASVNLQLKELQARLNAVLAELRAGGVIPGA